MKYIILATIIFMGCHYEFNEEKRKYRHKIFKECMSEATKLQETECRSETSDIIAECNSYSFSASKSAAE